MLIKEILRIAGGRLESGDPDRNIDLSGISTDSRTIKRGEFFAAVRGPNFDGNDFVETAFKKGAAGALVARRVSRFKNAGRIIIEVEDTIKALQDIAGRHRMKFKIPVIGVTGSNGKTTVKEMLWKILSAEYNVLKNEGTKNNYIGVPLALLKLKACHEICVLEMGMNHRGEIGLLSNIAKPSTAVITNIGPSHLEFLRDLKGVFEAKREILESLDKKGLAVLNGDDEFLSGIKRAKFDIVRFGLEESGDFRATDISIEKARLKFLLNGKTRFTLNLLGVHNIYNALAAVAAASQFNVSRESMRKALFDYKPGYMRLNVKRIGGIEIIDDSYNSNPSSMKCALEALENYPAKARWVVSGDMLELGRYGRHFHRTLGETIARSSVRGLVAFGRLSKVTLSGARESGMDKNNLWHCPTHDEAARILRRVVKRGDVVLVKGSRAMRMEKIVEKFKNDKF